MRAETPKPRATVLGALAFAAVAALGSIPWTMVAGAVFGRLWAVAAYCLGTVALYVVAVAPSFRRGVEIGALAAIAAIAILVLAPWPSEAILGAAVILAVARSGFLYRSRPARALLLESVLTLGGLVFAGLVATPTPLGAAFAIWAFFLVQSLYFVAGGVGARAGDEPPIDPFERARKKALAVIEGP